ncbi:ATP-binding protein [Pseudomonas mosselii]|uniref:AAA family ATPase n=1 Tax=Pseudomonas mosselii TaxID=78327 RepID=UPI001FF8D6A0|nr:ATP-binding protein [Pseudomonas mosselii]UPF02883.1 ATP-binding protein [Pseudomonas mosselii]
MIFKGVCEYKGFNLEHIFEFNGAIAVLTGKNGSGKTRFLESVKNGVEVVDSEGAAIPVNIKRISSEEMRGAIHNLFNREDRRGRLNSIAAIYKRDRDKFSSPYNPGDNVGNPDISTGCTYEDLHKGFALVAKKLGKSVWDLQEDEIKLHFEAPTQVWGGLDIGGMSNEYLVRMRENLHSLWLSKEYGYKKYHLPPEDLDAKFGGPPWLIFDEVLRDIFDGKISIDPPLDLMNDETYVPLLREVKTGEVLPVDGLSSGEKNLLWLANTIFKLRYKTTTGFPDLILLDEPDAFLHPKMVVKFYSLIQFLAEHFGCRVMFTTHSPTTVALAPEGCVFRVAPNGIVAIEKDEAIADLLDGVSQISLSSSNRREVFVESKSDGDLYRYIFDKIKSRFSSVDPKISLSFLVAGPKMPIAQVEAKIKQHLGRVEISDVKKISEELNGVGDCGQVIAMVQALSQAGNLTVRGVVDWDLKNKPGPNIVVSGYGVFYTIENIMLNPVYLLRLLYGHDPLKYPLSRYCGREVSLREWMDDIDLLQTSVDNFILEFTCENSKRNSELRFLGGHALLLDEGYLLRDGHGLMKEIVGKYRELNAFYKRDGDVLFSLVKAMVDDFGWRHVPCSFEETFSALQR